MSGPTVVTSSIGGKVGAPGQAAYSMSKFGVGGFFEGLRFEVTGEGIDVGVVCPGPVRTSASSFGGRFMFGLRAVRSNPIDCV